jgi:hypothetical protein
MSAPRFILSAAMAGLLSACAPGATVDQIPRDVARSVVRPIVAERFPGAPVALTDCIIDNAATHELIEIAKAATIGPGTDTYAIVLGIARRPEVLQCAAVNALPTLIR